MAKFAEGNRVFTAASGVDSSAATFRDIVDQLKVMFGPQWVTPSVISGSFDLSAGATKWILTRALGWLCWECLTSTSTELIIPLGTLRSGQRITAVRATVYCTGAVGGGSIKLLRQLVGAAVAVPFLCATFPPNPWDGAGVWTEHTGAMVPIPDGGLIDDDHDYYLEFTPTGTTQCRVLGGRYYVQFGS